jgi:hypothetical protein
MKRTAIILVFLVALLSAYTHTPAQAGRPGDGTTPVTIEVVNPPSGVLTLGVGESYTFEVRVSSDATYTSVILMPNAYYPGRGVFHSGPDRAGSGTSATLYLTYTGKSSTADLPNGSAPVSVVVGVRFPNGEVVSEDFAYEIAVP